MTTERPLRVAVAGLGYWAPNPPIRMPRARRR